MVVALVIVIVLALVFLAAILRLIWRVSRGDIQIEPSSHGRQLFGRSEKSRDLE
jgi:hypothetical protein